MLTGFGRYYGGFGSKLPYEVYFAVKLNVAPSEVKISDGGEKSLYAQISLPDGVKHVRLVVGISLKNSGNALAFLEKETVGRSFVRSAPMPKVSGTARWVKYVSEVSLPSRRSCFIRPFTTVMSCRATGRETIPAGRATCLIWMIITAFGIPGGPNIR